MRDSPHSGHSGNGGKPRNLAQWLDYIQSLHARSIDLSLERVKQVWQRFKPERLPIIITIAGTNGKGSSAAMLEAVYREAGFQTGMYTSPHLVHFNERFVIKGDAVDDAQLLQAFASVEQYRGDTPITFFEFSTLIALLLFCEQSLDVIIMEVGLGGRLDAVNILDNDLALISSISIDHTAWLGSDREKIGFEKAGVIKYRGRAVIAEPEPPKSISTAVKKCEADCLWAGHDFTASIQGNGGTRFESSQNALKTFNGIEIASPLKHVQNNTVGVIAVIGMLKALLPVSKAQLMLGLSRYKMRGRLQLLDAKPRILLDVSHNEASILAMIDYLDSLKIKGRVHAVFGALADKTFAAAIMPLLDKVDAWYLSDLNDSDRGQSASSLKKTMFKDGEIKNTEIELFQAPKAAYDAAQSAAQKADLIVIFGSFHLVGAILPFLELK